MHRWSTWRLGSRCRARRGASRPPPAPKPLRWTVAASLVLLAACEGRNAEATQTLDAAALRTGAAVYQARCASCHGARGEGAEGWTRPGPGGAYPAPPHDSTGHTSHHADGLLYHIVARGTAAALGDTLHAARYAMPGFASTLSPGEIHAVVTYLKAGWTAAQRRHQAEASRADPFPETIDAR